MCIVRLQSSDGKVIDIDVQIAKCSGTIKALLEGCGMYEGPDVTIPLTNVDSVILGKVLEWVNFHKDDPVLLEDEHKERSTNISLWDTAFLKADPEILFELMLAANYLDISGLLKVSSKKVAHRIKGKTSKKLRTEFGLKNDFSKAEMQEFHQKNVPLTL